MGERDVERLVEGVDPYGVADQRVEQSGHPRTPGPHVATDVVPCGRRTRMRAARPDRQHRPARVGFAERVERPAGGVGVLDDDGGQRLAEGRLDGGFPPGVDLDQVEHGAEHALDAGEPFGAGPGVGGVERELQGFRPRLPTRGRLGGVVALDRAALQLGLGRRPIPLCLLDLRDER